MREKGKTMVTEAAFIEILRDILNGDRDRLTAQFEAGARLRARDGWAWDVFVQSYATNGGVRTWEAFLKEGGAELVRWDALLGEDEADVEAAAARLEALSHRFLTPRWAARTRPALLSTFRRFHAVGGPDRMARNWNGHNQPDSLLRWLKTFPMIGDKYARNMCMDVSHPLILDHIALDHRIHTICDVVEGAPPRIPYGRGEGGRRGVANQLGINGWYLDRLLFGRYEEIKAAIA